MIQVQEPGSGGLDQFIATIHWQLYGCPAMCSAIPDIMAAVLASDCSQDN